MATIKILCGASVRRDPAVLARHLETLRWQILPPDVQLDLCHVDDFEHDQRKEGRRLLTEAGSRILSVENDAVATIDFDDKNPQTHAWNFTAFARVAKNKQAIFDLAAKEGYDYVWICDTDLLLDRRTLWSMLYAEREIVASVYWTRWQADQPQAGPQVWLRHPYGLEGRGMDAAAFRSRLLQRDLVRVWGLGACMLVRVSVLNRGVRYAPLLPELVEAAKQPNMGMLAGEDRTFCVLAERHHIGMWADAWPDIFHVYRPDDLQYADAFLEEFSLADKAKALYPAYGDYVSLQIVSLENPHVPNQHIRGRLGALKLLPELESAVLHMQPGDRRLLRLTFPDSYPLQSIGPSPQQQVPYRGHSRSVQLTLVDHKPAWPAPPVVRDEIRQVGESGIDRFIYSPSQMRYFRSAQRTD